MRRTFETMIRWFIKNPTEVIPPAERIHYVRLEAWVSIVGNILLAILKAILGFLTNSISLIADAIHTLSDVITSIVVLVGFKFATMPADEKHPYGHGRIEFIITLLISLLLAAVGIKLGYDSILRFQDNTPVQGTVFAIIVMLFSCLIKEWMARFSNYLGKMINSPALAADGWHHRTDAIASFLVALAMVASYFQFYRLDSVFGLLVSLLIIYTGYEIFMDSASKLIGEVSEDEMSLIKQQALTIIGVHSVHDIHVHDYGMMKDISLHIEVDRALSMVRAHEIAEEVEKLLQEKFPATVVVHADELQN